MWQHSQPQVIGTPLELVVSVSWLDTSHNWKDQHLPSGQNHPCPEPIESKVFSHQPPRVKLTEQFPTYRQQHPSVVQNQHGVVAPPLAEVWSCAAACGTGGYENRIWVDTPWAVCGVRMGKGFSLHIKFSNPRMSSTQKK